MQHTRSTSANQTDPGNAPAQNNRRLRRAAAARARRGLAGPVELTPNPLAQTQGSSGLFVTSAYSVRDDDVGGDR
jgi:hypothetical protein